MLNEREDFAKTYLEHGTVRDTNRQVSKYGQRLIGSDTLERKIMCDLMNGEEKIVIERAADRVRAEYEQRGPREGVSQEDAGRELGEDDTKDDPLGERLVPHEFGDLSARSSSYCALRRDTGTDAPLGEL